MRESVLLSQQHCASVNLANSIDGRRNHRTVAREAEVEAATSASWIGFDLGILVEVAGFELCKPILQKCM